MASGMPMSSVSLAEFYCFYFLLVLWVPASHLRLYSTLGLSLRMVQGGLMSFVCMCLFNNCLPHGTFLPPVCVALCLPQCRAVPTTMTVEHSVIPGGFE